MPDWLKHILSSRGLSLLVAAVYLMIPILALLTSAKSIREVLGMLLIMAGGLLIPLACIWFGDELGGYVGLLPGPAITKRSPGWLVKAAGWFLLLLPAIAFGWFIYNTPK
jgi:hypothetical protein